jgi:hypothetical protein
MPEQENEQIVYLSDYILGRAINKKLYNRLVEKLTVVCDKYRSGKTHFKGFETLTMKISMSAKYQTPYVAIHLDNENYNISGVGAIENDVNDALEEVGFSTSCDYEEKGGSYIINFED